MPSTIPYNPNLQLASIVHADTIAAIQNMADAAAPADAAQDYLNNLLSLRYSLGLTKTELLNLGVKTDDIDKEMDDVDAMVAAAASEYAKARIASEKQILAYKSGIKNVNFEWESPIDFTKTGTKTFPYGTDSMNLNVQYFKFDENNQNSQAFAMEIGKSLNVSLSVLGRNAASEVANTAKIQTNHQASTHSIEGTLVVAVTCTMRNALMLAPLVFDVDKGIRIWNKMFPSDKIKMDDPAAVAQIAKTDSVSVEEGKEDYSKSMNIISGVSYGASFVGLVHILNVTDTDTSQRMQDIASTMQAQMSIGAWFASAKGGFGVSDEFANDVKNLLSSQNISSHIDIVSMGLIPSVVANDIAMSVATFADFDPAKQMDMIGKLSASTHQEQQSVAAAAESARTGGQLVALQGATITSALSGLEKIESDKNSVLDLESMMTALQDFVKRVPDETSGVPINYYIKPISKAQLAQMWVAKYMPNQFLMIANDDGSASSSQPGSASIPASAGDNSTSPP